MQGEADLPRFIEESVKTFAPAEWYKGVRAAGILATFDGANTWVDHPYHNGIALMGGAAASSDPTWGQRLSLTVRDARVLRDQLVADNDWDAEGHAYAAAHARRAKALPLIAQDETRVPDHRASGPDILVDETLRRRFFGEE